MSILLIVLLMLVLGLSALKWGDDSVDTFDSLEWERRRLWRPAQPPDGVCRRGR